MKKKPKRRPLGPRIQSFAEQAYLAVLFAEQGDVDGFNMVLGEMGETLECDKKLAQHLTPGLQNLCRDKGLELHGHHITKTEKH